MPAAIGTGLFKLIHKHEDVVLEPKSQPILSLEF